MLKNLGSQKALFPLKNMGDVGRVRVAAVAAQAGGATGALSWHWTRAHRSQPDCENEVKAIVSKKDVLKKRSRNFRALASAEESPNYVFVSVRTKELAPAKGQRVRG